MIKVKYINIIKKIFIRLLAFSTISVVFTFPIKLSYKTNFINTINSISSIRGYQGLVLDDAGLGSAILNVFEKTSQSKIQKILILKDSRTVFSRNFANENTVFGSILSMSLMGSIDDYEIEAITNMDFKSLVLAFLFSLIIVVFVDVILFFKRLNDKKEDEIHIATEISKHSQQVSHDIRSPLAALEMLSSQLDDLSEEKRILLRNAITRIRDIANSLVKKESNHVFNFENGKTKTGSEIVLEHQRQSPELMTPLIDSLVSEKRVENRSNIGIKIEFFQSETSYGLISSINSSEFKRIVSNLINNAVEAFPYRVGTINVDLKRDLDGFAVLSVSDNGKGISSNILPKLFTRGATFGKSAGLGLGLYNARELIMAWGGKIVIDSKVNMGTTVKVFLPVCDAPDWFLPKLELNQNSTIVVFDDDVSIHQVWANRFAGLKIKTIVNLNNVDQFRAYYRKNFAENDVVYLVDYEIIGEKITGLDLIEELAIGESSILVTSRYDDLGIRSRCAQNAVSLIPKPMSGFVPIEII